MVLGGIVRGDSSINVMGTGNSVEINMNLPRKVNRTILYDVCQQLSMIELNENVQFSIQGNSNWDKKIKYNKIKKYRRIFELYCVYYDDISTVLSGVRKSTTLIRNIKAIYLDIREEYDEEFETIDLILDKVLQKLNELIIDSSEDIEFSEEERKEAVYLVMFYAFTKCQLLERVPEGWSEEL